MLHILSYMIGCEENFGRTCSNITHAGGQHQDIIIEFGLGVAGKRSLMNQCHKFTTYQYREALFCSGLHRRAPRYTFIGYCTSPIFPDQLKCTSLIPKLPSFFTMMSVFQMSPRI